MSDHNKICRMYHSVSTGIYSNTGHLDTVTISQFKRRISHVPNLIRKVTALRCDPESTVSN